jgi:hypothetical protein
MFQQSIADIHAQREGYELCSSTDKPQRSERMATNSFKVIVDVWIQDIFQIAEQQLAGC